MNIEYFKKVVEDFKKRCSYQEQSHSNYNDYDDFRKYFEPSIPNHSHEEKEYRKKFYRLLAREFHPDNRKDDGMGMKYVNGLKKEWNI